MGLFVPQTDRIQLDIAYGYQTLERVGWVIILGGKSPRQEGIIPLSGRQPIEVRHDVIQPHVIKAYLVISQGNRTEMGVYLTHKSQGIALLIFHINVAEAYTRRKTIFHSAYRRMCSERVRKFGGSQLHRSRLHLIAHQHPEQHRTHQ